MLEKILGFKFEILEDISNGSIVFQSNKKKKNLKFRVIGSVGEDSWIEVRLAL